MDRTQKKTFLILFFIALLYFIIFIFPNLTGAKDVNMLSVFEQDEFAQYPYLIHMITPGATLFQSLHNFAVYGHYYYGYPFYFFSALAILPVKWILGIGWSDNTSLIVLVLRQLINVLPMIISAFLLVWIQTKFKTLIKSILLFVLLLTVPVVVSNNMWWHPDSLLTLFSVLTIFFLIRDDFRFGRNFFLSGVACGFAIGSKILGVLFVLTYIVYIVYGMITRKVTLPKAVLKSFLFLIVLISTVIVSNPLLLLPLERSEILSVFQKNLSQSTQGFWVIGNGTTSKLTEYVNIFFSSYGMWFFCLLSLAALVYGCCKAEYRSRCLIISTWFIGYSFYFLVVAATMRSHYFIPIALPLFSCLAFFFPDSLLQSKLSLKMFVPLRQKMDQLVGAAVILVILVQIGSNVCNMVDNIRQTLNREQTSASIKMYEQAQHQYLDRIPSTVKVKIYRDWRAYVQPQSNYQISINWDLANYAVINDINPDFLFIEYENALYFSDASKLQNAIRPSLFKQMNLFYTNAIDEDIEGYTLLMKTEFGYVFSRDDIYLQYFMNK